MLVNINSYEESGTATECQSRLPAKLLSLAQVADFLGVHPSTVRRWVMSGLLKSYAIGMHRNLRFKQQEVLSFVDKCQQQTAKKLSSRNDSDKGKVKIKPGGVD